MSAKQTAGAQSGQSDEAEPLTPEKEDWVIELAEKHNLGRRMGHIGPGRGMYPDVFFTDASYRTHELFCFAAELLATQRPASPLPSGAVPQDKR